MPRGQAYYADLEVGAADGNYAVYRKAQQWDVARNIRDLDQPVDKYRWGMSPPTVNAYYSPSKNLIAFPAGILQPPFWHGAEALDALNYGGIGSVIGHELTHGFDDSGARYDADGNLKEWWPEQVSATFRARTACVANEYAAFSVGEDHVNGTPPRGRAPAGPSSSSSLVFRTCANRCRRPCRRPGNLTLGENIADNGGIKQSFTAWSRAAAGSTARLPGLPELSPQQLFFVSFAQVWCGTRRPASAHRAILTDPHSPHRFRVNGVMMNTQPFADAFQCPVGSPMSPKAGGKCAVW